MLLMRQDNDERKDYIVKIDMLKKANIKFENIAFAIDDSLTVCDYYNKHKIKTLKFSK